MNSDDEDEVGNVESFSLIDKNMMDIINGDMVFLCEIVISDCS